MRRLSVAAILLALAIGGGCTKAEKTQARDDAQNLGDKVQTAAASAKQAVGDTALAAKVKTALGMRKGIEASDIDVDAKDGAVTLKGDVDSQSQADLAVEVAEGTEGVRLVTNQLMVRVPARGSTPPR
jgi:hyperosmotically inducible periplasmic protein